RTAVDEPDSKTRSTHYCGREWVLLWRGFGPGSRLRPTNCFAECRFFTSRIRSWHHNGLGRHAAPGASDRSGKRIGDVPYGRKVHGGNGSANRTGRWSI